MKILFFLTLSWQILFSNQANGEIIDLQKNQKNFGDWLVICENDVMIDIPYCKIAAKFYEKKAVISLEPSSKLSNQMIMIIPDLITKKSVQIRIDRNDIIFSHPVKTNDFGLIEISPNDKSLILSQMKKGDFLFIRFNVNNTKDPVTIKLDLKDFREAFKYYQFKLSLS